MKLSSAIVVLLSCFAASAGLAQVNPLPPFKAICVSEKETGFDWKSGEWIHANFKPGKQTLVQKLDLATYATRPLHERPVMCGDEPPGVIGTTTIHKGCYLIREVGSKAHVIGAESCNEINEGQSLKVIRCSKFTFHPDGRYIEFPWHSDISSNPKNDYKDSLVLSVGKCSRLAD